MTDQMFVFLCRDVRKYAFDYRRGELQAAEHKKFEQHVSECAKCRDYLDRLEGMLDAAAIHEYAPELDRDDLFGRIVQEAQSDAPERVDRDELFDRITAEIDVSDSRPAVAVEALQIAEPVETAESDRDDEPTRRPVALYVVAALAAGVLIGVGLGFLYPLNPAPTPAPVIASKTTPDMDSAARLPVQPVPTPALALNKLTMQPTPAAIDDVRVFGEAHASWDIRTQGARRKLELKQGTVLVEFVPRNDHELEFVADRFTVHVTGTIFYASSERGIVGVVTGSVDVETKDGDHIRLVDGQEWVWGEGLRRAPASVQPEVAVHIDVEEHQRTLELLHQKPPKQPAKQVDPPRPPLSKEVKLTPRERLRAEADRALREGRYDIAAQYYERMVEELSAADPANASLRLDLARIYIRHLGQQRRAIVHLRRFVDDRPQDPLTPSARDELCRIADDVGAVEQQCLP